MTVSGETNVTISIDQTDSRILDNDDYSYSYFRLTVGKLSNGELEFIDSAMSAERNIFIEDELEAGEYMILVEAYWSNDVNRTFNIGTYSDRTVELELL